MIACAYRFTSIRLFSECCRDLARQQANFECRYPACGVVVVIVWMEAEKA